MLLRYEISSWTQVGQCLSNTDRRLHLVCSRIMSTSLQGMTVRVEHDEYGCLFSYLIDGYGASLSDLQVTPFTTDQILEQLKRFGFYIVFKRHAKLPGKMLQYLLTLDGLGYDKIRIMFVDKPKPLPGEDDEPKWFVVAFKVKEHPKWINNTYRAKESEISEGTMNGTVINISAMSQEKRFDWNFLGDYVLNIKDILEENSREV